MPSQTTFYHISAIVARNVENGQGLRSQLYSGNVVENKKDLPKIQFLVNNALQKKEELDEIISKTDLCKDSAKKDRWLIRILVTELVLGKKSYRPACPVMKAVYKKKAELKKIAAEMKVTRKTEIKIPKYVRVDVQSVVMSDVHKYLADVGGFTLVENCKAADLRLNWYSVDGHVPALLAFHPKASLHELDWVTSRKLIIQDKSSCLVAHLLAPHPGSTVLDMCAAPGLKTQHVSSISFGLSKIVAVEKDPARYKALCETKQTFSLDNLTCVHSDVLNTENLSEYASMVEYILLDPPCSGSGMVKNYDFNSKQTPDAKRCGKLSNLQAKMLRSAFTNYPAARRITYSTCSISEEENESVIEEFAEDPPEGFVLVDLSPFYPGLSRGLPKYKCGSKCIRLSPEEDGTNGFFIAMFERLQPPALPHRSTDRVPPVEQETDSDGEESSEDEIVVKLNGNQEPSSVTCASPLAKAVSNSEEEIRPPQVYMHTREFWARGHKRFGRGGPSGRGSSRGRKPSRGSHQKTPN